MSEQPQDPKISWPDPTPEMLQDPAFEAIWQCIKRWDINAGAYRGYMGATGNHVRAILQALDKAKVLKDGFHLPKEEE